MIITKRKGHREVTKNLLHFLIFFLKNLQYYETCKYLKYYFEMKIKEQKYFLPRNGNKENFNIIKIFIIFRRLYHISFLYIYLLLY